MAVQHILPANDQLASAGSPVGSRQDGYQDQGPLPGHARVDLSSLKLLTVPDAAPPFDGEVLPARAGAVPGPPAAAPAPGTVLGAGLPLAGIGEAARADAPVAEIDGEAARAGAQVAGISVAVASQRQGIADTWRPGNPGPGPAAECDWTQQFAWLLVEALAGARPLRQLLPWLSDRARVHLRRVTPVLRSGQRPRVLRVLASQPASGVVEMSVIVGLGSRTRALAVRLEEAGRPGQPGRWLCTDIEAA
ncbi:MAG TPA: Rv3235 family protein [Trebonia sp.]